MIGDGDDSLGFTGPHDQVGTATSPIDPLLARLGDYGGPTQTMALLPGSPAIGKGAALGQTTDQRGFPLDSPSPDIGAFQTQSAEPLVVTETGDSGEAAGELDLREAVNLANVLGTAEMITFAPGLSGTIALNGPLPTIKGDVTIVGPAPTS